MIIKFLLYGLLGWAAEILFTGIGSFVTGSLKLSGHTYVWMFPIYGMVAFLDPIYKRVRCSPWIIRGIIWASIIFFIEYVSGWVLKLTIGICPWDYSLYSRYTIDGFIRLDYFPLWFIAGLIFEKINDFLNRLQVTYLSSSYNPTNNQNNMIIILKDGKDLPGSFLTRWWGNGKLRL
jgi:uncharacterized membrane protein